MQVAEKVAGLVKDGGFVELVGDVGSGKTTFVKGLAKALGHEGEVNSPSFALKNVYDGKIRINHFDLYRLEEPGIVRHELQEAAEDNSVTVIEWGQSAKDILPNKRVTVSFSITEGEARKLRINVR